MKKTKQESLKFNFRKVNSAFLSFLLLEKIEGKMTMKERGGNRCFCPHLFKNLS